MSYFKGKYLDTEAAALRGWIVGNFDRFKDGRKTEKVEIKHWYFKINEKASHPEKIQKKAIEITFVIKGQVQGTVDSNEIVLSKGEFVVIPPGVKNNLVKKVIKDCEGFTVKAPSDPADKVEME